MNPCPLTAKCVQLYEFGGSQSYDCYDGHGFKLLLAFPHLKEDVLKNDVLTRWMNQVVTPVMKKSSVYFYHWSIEVLRAQSREFRILSSEDFEREGELDRHLDFHLGPEQLQLVWDDIQQKVQRFPKYKEFRNILPVIWAAPHRLSFCKDTQPKAFQALVEDMEDRMIMEKIPPECVCTLSVTESEVNSQLS